MGSSDYEGKMIKLLSDNVYKKVKKWPSITPLTTKQKNPPPSKLVTHSMLNNPPPRG